MPSKRGLAKRGWGKGVGWLGEGATCESSAILAAAICWVVGVRGELAMVLKAT
jgi:hypothetical protein